MRSRICKWPSCQRFDLRTLVGRRHSGRAQRLRGLWSWSGRRYQRLRGQRRGGLNGSGLRQRVRKAGGRTSRAHAWLCRHRHWPVGGACGRVHSGCTTSSLAIQAGDKARSVQAARDAEFAVAAQTLHTTLAAAIPAARHRTRPSAHRRFASAREGNNVVEPLTFDHSRQRRGRQRFGPLRSDRTGLATLRTFGRYQQRRDKLGCFVEEAVFVGPDGFVNFRLQAVRGLTDGSSRVVLFFFVVHQHRVQRAGGNAPTRDDIGSDLHAVCQSRRGFDGVFGQRAHHAQR